MNNILSLKFWFNIRPGDLLPTTIKIFIIVLASFVLLAIIFHLFKKNLGDRFIKRVYGRLSSFFSTNFFIGLIVLFFMYERTPVLAMRFWFIVWWLEMLIWLFFIIKQILRLPQDRENAIKEKEYKKYIP